MARVVPDSLAFPAEEYEGRIHALRRSLDQAQLDALVVTSPANVCYLTGYSASWYAPRLPVGVIVRRDTEELAFIDWSRHEEHVPMHALHDELIPVDYGTAPAQLAEAMHARGWTNGRIGLEWSSPNPVAAVTYDLATRLEGYGAEVLSGDWLVDDLRVYKSPAELECVARASAILDSTYDELAERLRPGLTELEIAAMVTQLLAERGSEVPAQHPLVSSGPTAWADVHAFPSRREIQHGEIISIDACAVVNRYHVNLSRTFVVDGWNQTVDDYLRAGAECLEYFCSTARIGVSPAGAMKASEKLLRLRVPSENVWWVGGYGLGLAFPPSWVGHTYLADDGPRPTPLGVGYVSNFETVMFDRTAGFETAAIDTIVVEAGGVRALSRIPRGLIRV